MITERYAMTIRPAPKLACALAGMATLPAFVLLAYDPPLVPVVVLLVASLGITVPAIRALLRPQMALVINGTTLLNHDSNGRLVWRAQRPRAVVTPWALSVWLPFQRGVTIFRGQINDADYRRLAAWLHR